MFCAFPDTTKAAGLAAYPTEFLPFSEIPTQRIDKYLYIRYTYIIVCPCVIRSGIFDVKGIL